MLTVTPAAREYLLKKLNRKDAALDCAMRFTRPQKRWRLRLDQVQPGDAAITHQGRNVLLLDAAVSKAMATLTLDVGNGGTTARLKLRRTGPRSE